MSKNTSSTQFRKIDVDQYCEDAFRDEENAEVQSPVNGVDEQEISSLLQGGKFVDALKQVLSNAPVNSKNQHAKDTVHNLVMQILLTVRAGEIDKVVDALDLDQIDVLMKYIYRGFDHPNDGSSAHLLIWHEKTYNKGGVGSIVRVLTDKKRV